ncbi:hypothetical protein HNQ54_001455 [Anaerocolumna cellulosilytica]|nr:hypothetical protein [Anaerocolumna cellulosilytica]
MKTVDLIRQLSKIKYERGETMVELDQFKYTLGTYEQPLIEVGDSL